MPKESSLCAPLCALLWFSLIQDESIQHASCSWRLGFAHEREGSMIPGESIDIIDISVVIPAHNEATRILPYLRQVVEYFNHQPAPTKCWSSTMAVPTRRPRSSETLPAPLRLCDFSDCRNAGGKGLLSDMECSGLSDTFSCLPMRMEPLPSTSSPGSKKPWQMEGMLRSDRALAARLPDFSVRSRLSRGLLGFLFNAAAQQIGFRGMSDTQCGFKLFRREVAQELFAYPSIDGFGFDLEILYLAQQRGYRIKEVPVNWSDQRGSKVRILRNGFSMLHNLAQIRRNYKKGRYDTPSFSSDVVVVGSSHFESPLNMTDSPS